MEGTRSSKAIVLKRQDIRENDSLVLLYTQDYGKLSLLARGTKKPGSKLVGHLEPLNYLDLMIVPGKTYNYVGALKTDTAFLRLKDDIEALKWAFAGLNSFLKMISSEGEEDRRLFGLLLNYLKTIDGMAAQDLSAREGQTAYAVFIFRLLSIIGYQPQIDKCLHCHLSLKDEYNYFDLKNGGLLCPLCFFKRQIPETSKDSYLKVSDSSIKLLRFILSDSDFLGKKIKFNVKLGHEIASLASKYLEFRL